MSILKKFNIEKRASVSRCKVYHWESERFPVEKYGKIDIIEKNIDFALKTTEEGEKSHQREKEIEYEIVIEKIGTIFLGDRDFKFADVSDWLKQVFRRYRIFEQSGSEVFKTIIYDSCKNDEDKKMAENLCEFIFKDFLKIDFSKEKIMNTFVHKSAFKFAESNYFGYNTFLKHVQDWRGKKTRILSVFGISEVDTLEDLIFVALKNGELCDIELSNDLNLDKELAMKVLRDEIPLNKTKLSNKSREYEVLRNARRILKFASDFFTAEEKEMYKLEWEVLPEERKLIAAIFSGVNYNGISDTETAKNYFISINE